MGPLQLDVRFAQGLVLVDEREIQLPTGEPWDQALAMVVEHGQGDVGVALVEERDGAGDERRNGGGEAGEPQPATSQAGDLSQFLLRLIQTGEHRLGVPHEGTAGVGEADGTHATLDQPGPGLALEGGDLLADRRLGE